MQEGTPMFAENPEYFDNPSDAEQNNISIDRGMGSDKQLLTAHFRNAPTNPQGGNVAPPTRTLGNEPIGASSEHDYYNETDVLNGKKKNPAKGLFLNPRTESVV